MGTLIELAAKADHSWIQSLEEDPEAVRHAPNKVSRQVKQGHFVRVRPTPLPGPKLVHYSSSMARVLGLSHDECTTEAFVRFFSGDIDTLGSFKSWCTPYAVRPSSRPKWRTRMMAAVHAAVHLRTTNDK
jgi:hypothetical protein